MVAVKKRHLNQLRGNRFRKARRFRKRRPEAYVEFLTHDVFDPPTFGTGAFAEPEMGEPITDPGTPVFEPIVAPNEIPVVPKISVEAEPYACHVCGAIEPNPCVTKTGNKAKQRHAGRDTL